MWLYYFPCLLTLMSCKLTAIMLLMLLIIEVVFEQILKLFKFILVICPCFIQVLN